MVSFNLLKALALMLNTPGALKAAGTLRSNLLVCKMT